MVIQCQNCNNNKWLKLILPLQRFRYKITVSKVKYMDRMNCAHFFLKEKMSYLDSKQIY